MTLQEWVDAQRGALPEHELEIFLQEALGQAEALTGSIDFLTLSELRAQMHTRQLTAAIQQRLDQWIKARVKTGVPVQHLTGFQVFLGHRYRVSSEVLIPRPETEVLVSEILDACLERGVEQIAEIGAGSGAIAIELLSALPDAQAVASELSAGARVVAAENARQILGEDHTRLQIIAAPVPNAVWQPFAGHGPFDLVVSNPPYLLRDGETTAEVAQFDPAQALYAPDGDPLFFYREILNAPASLLRDQTEFWLEIPHERADEILELARRRFVDAELKSDLTGRPRVLRARGAIKGAK